MVKERRDTLKQSMESLEGEIEALRQDMAIVNQQTHMLATQVYSDLVDKGRFEHEVIYIERIPAPSSGRPDSAPER